MSVELTGKVAIVTGAAQGIGEATVWKLAERGAHVVGVDIEGDLLTKVMDSLEGDRSGCHRCRGAISG